MIVKTTKEDQCECGAIFTIREYEGLEGRWYIDWRDFGHQTGFPGVNEDEKQT